MQSRNYGVLGLLGAIIIGLSVFFGLWIHGHEMASSRSSDTLTVTGSVKKTVTADLAKWTAGFSRRSNLSNVKETLAKMSDDRERVQVFIQTEGLSSDAITFLPIDTNPIYEQLPGYGQSQNIIGYTVHQEVRVENTDIVKIESLAKNIEKLVDQGILSDYQRTEYFYTKIEDLRPELFAAATKDALKRATAIASGTGASVGKIRSARTGVIQILAPNSLDVADYGAYDVSTKEKEVSATVNVSFAIN
jgi:hypothetical protein